MLEQHNNSQGSGCCYHQQDALFSNIARYIAIAGAESLLDVGAGLPRSALRISRLVRHYRAVEMCSSRAALLKRSGLEVTKGTFPLNLRRKYDFVLCSHSIEEERVGRYDRFLSAAWNAMNAAGTLLVVTFKGHGGDLFELREELGERVRKSIGDYEQIALNLRRKGGIVDVSKINSYAESAAAVDLREFLARWLPIETRSNQRIQERLLGIIEARYRVREGLFVFPFEHVVIRARAHTTR